MEYRKLGTTGMSVSSVSFGTAPLGGLFGGVEIEEARATLKRAMDLGINFIDTSPYYGDAEERLGQMRADIPDDVYVGTKAGRYGFDVFDFGPRRLRESLENSLRALGRERIDVFQLHDIDFVDLDPVLSDSYAELVKLRDEGKVRAIGMTCYSIHAIHRVITETDVDVVLNFAHGTLLDDSLSSVLSPIARDRGIGVINAAAVSVGMLTPKILVAETDKTENTAVAPIEVQAAARRMAEAAHARGENIAFLANQFAMQRVDCDTTVIGTNKVKHLEDAVDAATEPIDEDLLSEVLQHRLPASEHQWDIGIPANQRWDWS